MRRFIPFIAVLLLAACGRGEEAPAAAPAQADPAKGVVNLYTARHYDADQLIYDAFTRKTGIKVNRRETQPDQLIARMTAEAESSPADIVLMADAGALYRAETAGLFQSVTSPTLDARIPAALRHPERLWFGFSRRARVIALPVSEAQSVAGYESLAEPRFKGRVCVRSAENVYNLSLTAALIQRWGRERTLAWAKGVVANFARPPQGGDIEQIRGVAAGVCGVALTNTYYYLRLVRSGDAADETAASKVRLVFPDAAHGGTHVNISGGGVARHAPNRANAVAFLEYLASDEAQHIFADANSEYPAVAGVSPPSAVARFATFDVDPAPVVVYGRRQAEAQTLLDEAGWK